MLLALADLYCCSEFDLFASDEEYESRISLCSNSKELTTQDLQDIACVNKIIVNKINMNQIIDEENEERHS